MGFTKFMFSVCDTGFQPDIVSHASDRAVTQQPLSSTLVPFPVVNPFSKQSPSTLSFFFFAQGIKLGLLSRNMVEGYL